MVWLRTPAKLNLGLTVRARRRDGFHEIETLFVPIRLFDRLEIERDRTAGVRLECSDPDLPVDHGNLVVRAARATCRALGVAPALRIRLEKRIPVSAGLGGGSSDAAATVRGLETLFGTALGEAARMRLACGLGADVPFFLDPRPCLGRGIGDRLEPLGGVPEMWWLLIAFPFPVSTEAAYRLAAAELTPSRRDSSIGSLLEASGLIGSLPNDLETVVARLHPEIGEARCALDQAGARASGMSGSGPTVFGRFPDREAAEQASRCMKLPGGADKIVVSSPASSACNWEWGVAKW